MFSVGFLAATLLATAQQADPPVLPDRTARVQMSRSPHLSKWSANAITCADGQTYPGTTINTPIPLRHAARQPAMAPVTYEFTLGPQGRPLSIAQVGVEQFNVRLEDLEPAIAGSLFPASANPRRCTVTFEEALVPIVEAEIADLVLLRASNRSARVPWTAWRRFAPGDCSQGPSPRPLLIGYPDYRNLPRPPGARDWVFLTYRTDAGGQPVGIEIAESSGNDALNAAAETAVAQSRFDIGGRSGCVRYFWTGAGVVEAPERPDLDSYGTQPEACKSDDRWAREPRLRYPESFRRRGIEGWAVLRYDVAPWGEIGNIEVIEAQPAAALGLHAMGIVRSAAYSELETGLKGCIERVLFKLPERTEEISAEADE